MIDIHKSSIEDDPWQWFGVDNFIDNVLVDGTPFSSAPSVVHYAIEIDVSDSINIADENEIGLFADTGLPGNAFRWVTERPDYDGSTVVPTGDISATAIKWGEGIITARSDLGTPIRMIDITVAGDYGTLSGFNFSLDNVNIEGGNFIGSPLFKILEDQNIYVVNRKIRFYIVIDDVFFNVWSGIVGKISHEQNKILFTCEDDFKNIHKVIPPEVASEANFNNIVKKSIGKSIPVTLGYVNNARVLNVQTIDDPIVIFRRFGKNRKIAPLRFYVIDNDVNGNPEKSNVHVITGTLETL